MHFMPCMDIEYHSQYFYIGICNSGYSCGMYDYRETNFRAGDMCWILPDHVLKHKYASDDYSVLSVFMSKSYFQHIKQIGVLGKFQYMINFTNISLDKESFDIIYNCFRLLGMMTRSKIPNRDEIIASIFQIISTVGDNYISKHVPPITQKQKLHDELFERFYDAITEHYRESREVAFYARLFCRTPKYFATTIKQTTGISATKWINHYVIIEAKWLLLHERQKSVQQIANYLGFSEQASFSRLFKKYVGTTPTEYRAQN